MSFTHVFGEMINCTGVSRLLYMHVIYVVYNYSIEPRIESYFLTFPKKMFQTCMCSLVPVCLKMNVTFLLPDYTDVNSAIMN